MSKSRNLANLLADGVVGTTEIANSAITADKLANGAVTVEQWQAKITQIKAMFPYQE